MTGELKDFVRPPFANYDIVVYFGCGLFALPLMLHYIFEPAGFHLPAFNIQVGIPIADTVISTLSLLFSVYVVGHIIAYMSSIVIEKSIDSFFGKVSSAILISNPSGRGRRTIIIQAWIYDRLKKAFQKRKEVSEFSQSGYPSTGHTIISFCQRDRRHGLL
jgi:hypothetical protein